MSDDSADVLTPPEAMAFLRIGRDALYSGCAAGRIPHRKIGRAIRFSRAALVQWLAGRGEVAQEGA